MLAPTDAAMPPPPPGVPRRPSSKRALPPVPRETAHGPQQPPQPQPQSQTNAAAAAVAALHTATTNGREPDEPTSQPDATGTAAASASASASASAASSAHAAAASARVSSVSAYTVPLWSAAPLYPFSLSVIKDGRELAVIPLSSRSHFLLGRAADLCDIALDHLSVSRRHAVLQFHEHGSLWIQDLGTAHGTFRNKQRIAPHTFIELAVGDQLKFGASTRTYVIEGPDQFRPKEIDKEQIAQRQAAVQRQQVAAQQRLKDEAKHKAAERGAKAADAGGASWGMGEDAVDSEDDADQRDSAMVGDDGEGGRGAVRAPSALPAKLTPLQQRCLDKLEKKKEKMQNLAAEVETLRGKDIRQGGLSEGQEKQIAKNEERMQALATEIEELETQLHESIERVAVDREKSQSALAGGSSAGSKRRRGASSDDSQSDRSDGEDDFFDRTKSKLPKTSSGPKAAAPISAFIATLTPVEALTSPEAIAAELTRIEQKRDQLRHTLSEVVVQEAKSKRVHAASAASSASAADSLDSFMSGISHTQLSTRKDTLKTNLAELQAHYIKLQRLMEQRKGELRVQAYREGDAMAFARPAPSTEATVAADASAPVVPMSDSVCAADAAGAPAVPSSAPAPSVRPSSVSVAPAPSASAPVSVSAGGVISTADALARMKKKQEAHVRKLQEQRAQEDREDAEKASKEASMPVAVITRASVQAFIAESAPKAPLDRYALLAAQMESARGHKNYSALPDDDVSRALKARAAASANFAAATGMASEDRGGLHVRRKEDIGAATQQASASGAPSPSVSAFASGRVVGPHAPGAEAVALQHAHHQSTVDWTPPVLAAASGQDKLRAKFAGRY